jgi:hypothetical protein
MLYLLAQLSLQTADACTPTMENAELISSLPETGALSVSIDAVLRLEFGNGAMPEINSLSLHNNEQEIDVEYRIISQNYGMYDVRTILEVAPMEELPANEEFILSINEDRMMIFATGEDLADKVVGTPSVYWAEQYFQDNTLYGEMNSCEPNTETNLYIDFDYPETDLDQSLVLYRIEEGATLPSQEELENPFHMILNTKNGYNSVNLNVMNTTEAEIFCFQAAYVNEAGERGELSETFCTTDQYYDDFRCGTGNPFGCSAMPASNIGIFGMVLGVLGLSRRRRE